MTDSSGTTVRTYDEENRVTSKEVPCFRKEVYIYDIIDGVLEIHFVELPKFLDEQPELNTNLNKWLAFLTKPEKEVMEVVEMEEPAIRKAITVLDMLSRDPETVRLAELRMKKILDEKSMIEGAKEERNKEIAKKALSKGADISFVMEITGLSEEEVLKLKNEIENH